MEILLITTPAQHSTSNKAVIQDTKTLTKWVSELPVMDVIETVKLLQKAISSFNEYQMDTANRFKLLNIYYQALEEILFSYDEIRLHTLPVSSDERKTISEDIMWLFLGLANGYKIIIKQAHDEKLNPKRNSDLLTSIFRAIELILNGIVYAYKAHVQIPPLAQLEIKQLYSYSTNTNVHEVNLKSIKGHAFPPTISNIFKHFVLFHALEPQNFNSLEILELFLVLENYAPHCELFHEANIQPGKFKYLVNIDDDEAAIKYSTPLAPQQSINSVIIDVQPAIEAAQEFIAKTPTESNNLTAIKEQQLLQQAINLFSGISAQTTSTKQQSQSAKVINDFKAIINLLQDKEKITELTNVEYIGGIEVSNIDSSISAVVSDWSIVDENEAIRVLSSTPSKDSSFQAGDIIGLVEKMDHYASGMLLIAVIRKVKSFENNSVKLGIEIIPGQAIPVAYKGIDNVQHYGAYFSQIPALKRPASLLIEKQYFADDALSINNDKKWIKVKPTTKLLDLPNHILFDFKQVQ